MKLNIKSLDEADRPREKLLQKGRNALTNAELIAILLGSGNKTMNAVELSQQILAGSDNNLNQLSKLDVADLKKFNGIGEAKAITIIAALELGRRRQSEDAPKIISIKRSKDAYNYLYSSLVDLPHEEFWVLFVNKANRIIEKRRMSIGTISSTPLDIKILAKKAIELLANGVILAHNHPTGSLTPSKMDIELTNNVKNALALFDIKVLDHLIIGHNDYLSFADEGLV